MELNQDDRKTLTELILSFSPGLVLEPCNKATVEVRLALEIVKSSDLDALDAMALVSNLRKYHSTRHM